MNEYAPLLYRPSYKTHFYHAAASLVMKCKLVFVGNVPKMVETFHLHENETVALVQYIYQDGDSTSSPPKI